MWRSGKIGPGKSGRENRAGKIRATDQLLGRYLKEQCAATIP